MAAEPNTGLGPDVTAEEVWERFWLCIHEPRSVPRKKGPFRQKETADVLREVMRAEPEALITVVTLHADGPDFQHGPEWLQMLDGRSMGFARKHNVRVEEARLRAASLPAAAPAMQAHFKPDAPDYSRDAADLNAEPDRIWLQNAADADPLNGERLWSADHDDFEFSDHKPVEYVRADLVAGLVATARREAAAEAYEQSINDVARVRRLIVQTSTEMSPDQLRDLTLVCDRIMDALRALAADSPAGGVS